MGNYLRIVGKGVIFLFYKDYFGCCIENGFERGRYGGGVRNGF